MEPSVSVDLIPIDQDIPGFAPFFGAWLCRGPVNIVVDVGPANGGERLVEDLKAQGLTRLDYVLLTHIHIDHCGALAEILKAYPAAQVVCHEKGLPFLVNPDKLWAGSLGVLGDLAESYGKPEPIERRRLIPHTQSRLDGLTILETPGHAVHHLSFLYGGRLFAGEAGGNFFRVADRSYLRPATPPRFFLDVFLNSIDRLLEVKDQPICYAHYGANDHSRYWLKAFRDQLLRWAGIIEQEWQAGGEDLRERCIRNLLLGDPLLAAFEQMDADTQSRERTFMTNAVNGFLGFFDSKAKDGE